MSVRKALLIGGAAVLAPLATACSVATPDPSQMAVNYSGGPFASQDFISCIDPGDRHLDWPNNSYAYYPVGQRSWDFSSKPGAEAPPIKISTKNQTELYVSGSVTFTFDTDCKEFKEFRIDPANGRSTLVHDWKGGLVQRFHDTIGRHTGAFATEGGDPQPEGWNNDIALYIGGPLTIAMNNSALKYNWEDLYNNVQLKNDWQIDVERQLQTLVDQKAGARHFIINQVQLGKPELPDQLANELINNQAAGIRAQTANIDKATAANLGGANLTGLANYQLILAMAKAISSGQVKVIPVPTGSLINIPTR